MATTAQPGPADVRAKKLNRWSIGLFVLAMALVFATSAVLDSPPYVVSEAVSHALGVAMVVGVLSYLFVKGDRGYRNARIGWIVGWVLVLAAVPAVVLDHRAEERREAGKLIEVVKAMSRAIKSSDEEMSESIRRAISDATRSVLSGPAIADAVARKAARTELAAATKTVDDGLARRAKNMEDTVKAIEASGAAQRFKRVTVHELRAASKEPVAVQMAQGMRVFFAKAQELIALIDANAAGVEVRGDAIEIADAAVLQRYQALQAEVAASQQALRDLVQKLASRSRCRSAALAL